MDDKTKLLAEHWHRCVIELLNQEVSAKRVVQVADLFAQALNDRIVKRFQMPRADGWGDDSQDTSG